MAYNLYENTQLLKTFESKAEARDEMTRLALQYTYMHRFSDRYLVDVLTHDSYVEFIPIGERIKEMIASGEFKWSEYMFPQFKIEKTYLPYKIDRYQYKDMVDLNLFIAEKQLSTKEIVSITDTYVYFKNEDLDE